MTLLAGAARVFSHSTHHVEDQEPFSQDRREELERKWGTDVSYAMIGLISDGHTDSLMVGLQRDIHLRPSTSHTLPHTP